VRKAFIAVALCGFLTCSPASAKTFVGVLWPMFGPLPAFGLAELVGELKMMPDVEVRTYLHQHWPALVEDLSRQPKGTRTMVVGYSLGANASVFVANKSKYIDVIIALQPTMLSWNPSVTGRVGRMVEFYNPNPWMTFGGMGSKKLIGPNIEYVANNDTHPGAQFNAQFRILVKSEVARLTTEGDNVEVARTEKPRSPVFAQKDNREVARAEASKAKPTAVAKLEVLTEGRKPARVAEGPKLERVAERPRLDRVADERTLERVAEGAKLERLALASPPPQKDWTAFLDNLSSAVDSGYLPATRRLTIADMKDYAQRTYTVSRASALMTARASD
jgi:hypothetical protein